MCVLFVVTFVSLLYDKCQSWSNPHLEDSKSNERTFGLTIDFDVLIHALFDLLLPSYVDLTLNLRIFF